METETKRKRKYNAKEKKENKTRRDGRINACKQIGSKYKRSC